MSEERKIVLLVSGGPDSATLAKIAEKELRKTGGAVNAIYLKSGHPSDEKEIEAANAIIKEIGGKLEIIDISDMVQALGNGRVLIHSEAAILPHGNTLVLSLAAAYARRIGAKEIWIGLHKDDADENIEYTKDFISKLQGILNIISSELTINTPLLDKRKEEVFEIGGSLGLDYSKTWSCIRGNKQHCGNCGACRSRRRAFNLSKQNDPTNYVNEPLALDTAVHE